MWITRRLEMIDLDRTIERSVLLCRENMSIRQIRVLMDENSNGFGNLW